MRIKSGVINEENLVGAMNSCIPPTKLLFTLQALPRESLIPLNGSQHVSFRY